MKDLEQAVHVIRSLVEGTPIEFEGAMLQLPWTPGGRLPVWIAGYGPVALRLTGRVADGAMLQIGDPDLIRWFAGQVHTSAVESGREPGSVRIMAAAPAHVGDLAEARDRVRWFPALVANHVVDLVSKYDKDDLPAELTQYIRGREGYDYLHHAEVGSANAEFVTDEVVDRFSIVGSVDDHVAKLAELAAAGVDQFNLYLMNGDEEQQLEIYGREIIPALRTEAATRA
jgi:alkanesulfonate monooxygenase SsuD/methylene tetrahydromethanopterin reductase-like flavin-dependent oxidoreductase (luciferase family)